MKTTQDEDSGLSEVGVSLSQRRTSTKKTKRMMVLVAICLLGITGYGVYMISRQHGHSKPTEQQGQPLGQSLNNNPANAPQLPPLVHTN